MAITFSCPACGKELRAPEEAANRQSTCPGCRGPVIVPDPSSGSEQVPFMDPAAFTEQAQPPPPGAALAPMSEGLAPMSEGPAESSPIGFSKTTISIAAAAALLMLVTVAVGGYLGYRWFTGGNNLGSVQKYIPENSQFILSIQVDELLSGEAMQRVREEFASSKDFEKELHRKAKSTLGLTPAEIDQLVFAARLDEFMEGVLIVTTKKEVDASTLSSAMGRSASETKVGEFSVHKFADQGFCVADKKLVLYGQFAAIKKILERDRAPALTEGMANILAHVDFSKSLVMVADVKGFEMTKYTGVPPGVGGEVVKNLEKWLHDFEGLAYEADIHAELKTKTVLLCKDKAAAEDYEIILKGFTLLGQKLQTVFTPSEKLREELAAMNAHNEIERDGRAVVLTSRTKTSTMISYFKESQEVLEKLNPRPTQRPFRPIGEPIP